MMDHGESIYNIVPPREYAPEKPALYKSKFSGKQPPTASTFHTKNTTHPFVSNVAGALQEKPVSDKADRTFGKPPGALCEDPANFMKKAAKTGGKVPTLAEMKQQNPEALKPTHLKQRLQPHVPRADQAPIMNLVTSKNFVVANAVETILAAPKRVPDEAKDYLKKADYGKVPKYLNHIKGDIEAEYDYIQQLHGQREHQERQAVRPMTEEERLSLIDGLKSKWEQVNTAYQGTTHVTNLDTMGKMKRKEENEATLAQLEKDIEKLSKRNILVDVAN